jgi:hypothetical protein
LSNVAFVRNPSYKQRIASDIKYTLHTNGLVKCEFTKEVFEDSEWKSQPMYLLIGFKNQGYWIVGESDLSTDKKFRYNPRVGEALDLEILSEHITPLQKKLSAEIASTTLSIPDTGESKTISFSTVHLYLVIVLVCTGGLIIFFGRVKVTRPVPAQVDADVMEMEDDVIIPVLPEAKVPDQPYQVIENQLKQNAFHAYVTRLFNSLSFTTKKVAADADGSARGADDEFETVLEIEFSNRQTTAPAVFGIQSLYREDTGNSIRMLPPGYLPIKAKLEARYNLYYVIGVGGPPTSPYELYLVPSKEIRSDAISKDDLKPFRRTGSFYYDNSTGKLL